jgi:D-3-phosphoglycerate dehydrogenase
MPHVLVAGRLHPSGIDRLRNAPGFTFDLVDEVSEASYAPLIGRADALVLRTQPLTAATIHKASRLRIVSRHGVGYDAVDVKALESRGIALAVVGDVNSVAVAEHAMMLILAVSHRLLRADRAVRNGQWSWRNSLETAEVAGKRLLIVGFGRIGRNLARLARGFGMRVTAHDPFLTAATWPDAEVAAAPHLAEALSQADVVSLHVPRSDRPVLGAAEIARLKRGALIVNTARGGLIDEAVLAAALAADHVGGAGLDVFDVEPPPADHPLARFDQVILSPHIAALTRECFERMSMSAVGNVIDFFNDDLDPSLIVNRTHVA